MSQILTIRLGKEGNKPKMREKQFTDDLQSGSERGRVLKSKKTIPKNITKLFDFFK